MIKKIAIKIGLDYAILYTSSSRIIQGLGGLITVLLIASNFTGIEQGFYYTFGSIVAIQMFFELGMGGIINQFVAHEMAHLTEKNNILSGSEKHMSRLSHLLHLSIKWYSIISLILFVVLLVTGTVFFNFSYKDTTDINWLTPWILISLGTSLNFALIPIFALIEGLGKVKEISYMRLWQQIIILLALWGSLLLGFKLYAAVISPFVIFIISIYFILKKFIPILKSIYKIKITYIVSYKVEIFPLQWRMAMSWISGYFIFQIFNPVVFAYSGAVAAGQMGMTLGVLNAILGLAYSWMSTKVPFFSMLIARKEYDQLNLSFKKTLIQQTVIMGSCLMIMVLGVMTLNIWRIEFNGKLLFDRFLPIVPLVFMAIAFYGNQYISAIAIYLRCHKKEPLMVQSIVTGVLAMMSTLILGKFFGVMGVSVGYCIVLVLILPWTYNIYITKKREWHQF